MAYFEGPSAKQAEVIRQELGEGSDDLERGIRDLRSMCAANPYLPQPEALDRKFLERFLHGCRFDFERARNKLELYCYSRTRYPELFGIRSLITPPHVDVSKFLEIVPLPKLSDEGYRVTIFRVKPNYPDNVDVSAVIRVILYMADVRMCEDTLIAGDVFIWEVSHLHVGFAARMAAAMTVIRRGIHLAHSAYPQRLRRIHVIGAPGVFAASLNLMKSWVNEKIRQRYLVHTKTEDLLDYYPARILPAEWGGDEQSIDTLAKQWRSFAETRRDNVSKLTDMCQDIPETKCNTDIYGVVGSFRKLDID
ncbi:alpha-tocopherol transfer protein-like [Aricia agestis]|uniref:alpha-tocopherol transfer protein-like n=1 Tax=Aricia agestis TaxID=91739 RepID=UPI001C206378|nr:alpha-tocopherol transfer protein-like [Aricia agestis]